MKAGIYRPFVKSNHRAANSTGGRSVFPGNSYNPSLWLPVIGGGGIWTTGTWNWSPVGRLLLRRSRSNAIIRAITPIAPTATPTPIPALAPDERLSPEEDSEDVWVAVSAPMDGEEVDVDEDEEVVEDMDVVDVGVLLIFHPTTAMAPTVELLDKVVVDVTHAIVSDAGVDA